MVAKLGFDSGNDEETVINAEGWDDISDLQDDLDNQLHSIFSEVGGDERDTEFALKVYRVMEGKGKLEYCFSCVPSELPILDKLRDEYNGGTFEVRVYKDNRIYRRRKVFIAPPPKKPEPASSHYSPDMSSILREMAEQQNRQFEQMRNLFSSVMTTQTPAPTQQQPNMMEMMGAMVGIMTQMKEFVTPAQPQTNSFEQFAKVIEVVKDLGLDGSEKGPWDGLASLAKEFAGPLIGTVSQMAEMQKMQTPAPARRPQNPQAQEMQRLNYQPMSPQEKGGNSTVETPSVNPAQQTAPQNETEQMNMVFKMYLNQLCQKAAQDADPALYAELIIDNVPEAHIKQLIDRPDMIQFLSQHNPNVQQFAPWFIELQAAIREGLDPEPSGEGLQSVQGSDHNQGNASTTDPGHDATEQPSKPETTPDNASSDS